MQQPGQGKALAHGIIALLAVLLTLPAALSPMKVHDSFWIDWVWVDQFTEQLRQGVLYPRWLPRAHDGLGSPTFYFYPPLAFYLSALFGLAGLSTYGSILAAFGTGFFLSGLAMHAWLSGWTKRPLIGALVYMAAPYHVLDFYARGALAEFTAVALIPVVALGLRRLAKGERGGLPVTALAYGAMICTHLPLALLTSLFLIGPYALFLTRGRIRKLVRFVPPLMIGIALAAIYLVPALLLEPYRDASKLWADPALTAENWTLWSFHVRGPATGMRWMIVIMLAVLGLPAAVYALLQRSGWAAYGAACCILAAGVIPLLWSLPLLSSVQYPFRAFPLAEFGIATGLAVLPRFRLGECLALVPATFLTLLLLDSPAPAPRGMALTILSDRHPEVPENLPPGFRLYSWPSYWALDLAEGHRTPVLHDGRTVEPVFYFPAWQVQCAGRQVTTERDEETALLSYRGQGCSRSLIWTAPERIGAFVSGLAALVLMALAVLSIRRGRAVGRAFPAPTRNPVHRLA